MLPPTVATFQTLNEARSACQGESIEQLGRLAA
jgi:hypothetical protein